MVRRGENGRFIPGESPNPNGRPPGISAAARFREEADKAAKAGRCPVEGCDVAEFESWHHFVAHQAVDHGSIPHATFIDRYYPKPPAEVAVTATVRPTEEELQRIDAARDRLSAEIEASRPKSRGWGERPPIDLGGNGEA